MIFLINSALPDIVLSCLSNRFPQADFILLPPFSKLPSPVAAHPDMLSFYDRTSRCLFLYRSYFYDNYTLFAPYLKNGLFRLTETVYASQNASPISIVLCSDPKSINYPHDAGLDILQIYYDKKSHIFCKPTAAHPELISALKSPVIHTVKQGYTRCSTLIFDNGYVQYAVTADSGIASAIKSAGINVLYISDSNISLTGYSCGFIGGASLSIKEFVCFFGNIEADTEIKQICSVLSSASADITSFEFPLTDFGGATIIQ